MQDKYLEFIPFYVAESTAGTLTEDEINLPNNFLTRIGTEIHSIEVELQLPQDAPGINAIENVNYCITTQPFGAMGWLDEDYVIFKGKIDLKGEAAAGDYEVVISGHYPTYKLPKPILIVNQKIYVYIQSTNASTAAWVRGRIGVTFVKLTDALWREAYETWSPSG